MKNGIYHRKGLVRLKREDTIKLQGGNEGTFVIGIDNKENIQQYKNLIEIPPNKKKES